MAIIELEKKNTKNLNFKEVEVTKKLKTWQLFKYSFQDKLHISRDFRMTLITLTKEFTTMKKQNH